MKKRYWIFLAAVLFWMNQPTTNAEELVEMRCGWQRSWVPQGQLVGILMNTDIPANNGLKIKWIRTEYGPNLNNLALGNHIEFLLTGDQPGLQLLLRKPHEWQILKEGRLKNNRTVTYVPKNSAIENLAGLKGRTIGLPIGASVERNTIAALKKAGLEPEIDYKIKNVGVLQQGALVLGDPDAARWVNYDALAAFDLLPAILQTMKESPIKALEVSKVVSVIIGNKEFLDKHPGIAKKISNAFADAYDFYRQNMRQANIWFRKISGLAEVSDEACALAASFEPNLKAKSRNEIRTSFNKEDLSLLQMAAEFVGIKEDVSIFIRQGD